MPSKKEACKSHLEDLVRHHHNRVGDMKINFFDRRIRNIFFNRSSALSATISIVVIFIDIPPEYKKAALMLFATALTLIYVITWARSNYLTSIDLSIDGTNVSIRCGDIFHQQGLKAIAFNEYFDTQVDDELINERSLNGYFIKNVLDIPVTDLDRRIDSYQFEDNEVLERNVMRKAGKKQKYRLGTIFLHDEYILTSMSKFDESNRATLTMPEYLEFLIRFWDRVNKVYAQKSVSTPVFGSGITRIKGHKNISDEELLKIMLWTFKISEMRFKHPAKLSIVIHPDKMSQINLLDVKMLENGI